MLITVVVPVYNNYGTLRRTFDGIAAQFKEIGRYSFEVIFVNDGSKDNSEFELQALRQEHAEVKLISFTRNFGQASAMAAGNRHAQGECVINISADLQDPVELMTQMVESWESGFKIVACIREGRDEPLYRKIPSNLLYRFLRLSVPHYPAQGFDYYLIDRQVLNVINNYRVKESFITFDILDTGFKFFSIPYTRREREIGRSGYNFLKRVRAAFDSVVNSSFLPIRIMSFIGGIASIAGICFALLFIYARITNHIQIPGLAMIVVLILTTSGFNMLMLGLMGEYLWRALDVVKSRPDYIIREKSF